MTALPAEAALPHAALVANFDLAAVVTGLLFALIMAELLRIAQVAVVVAILVAGGLAWIYLQSGAPGLIALTKAAVIRFETPTATSFLTGALLGKALSALLTGLRAAAVRPLWRRKPSAARGDARSPGHVEMNQTAAWPAPNHAPNSNAGRRHHLGADHQHVGRTSQR